MLNNDHDVYRTAHLSCNGLGLHKNERYYAEVPALTLDEQSRLIEQVIHLAFDTLGARHLEVRVCGTGEEARGSACGRPP